MEPNRLADIAAQRGTYFVHFRLRNQGNQPIFYPVSPNTRRPVGQIVYRITLGGDWKLRSHPEVSTSGPDELEPTNIAWIEMPPGGWADGYYAEPGLPFGEHAYKLNLKLAGGGKVIRFYRILIHPAPTDFFSGRQNSFWE